MVAIHEAIAVRGRETSEQWFLTPFSSTIQPKPAVHKTYNSSSPHPPENSAWQT